MACGIIKKWIPGRGFGFITPDDGSDDLFTHISEVAGKVDLPEGSRVRYEPGIDGRTGKRRAQNVELL